MQKSYARYEVECSVDTGGGKHCGFVPRSDQDHHYQAEPQELVHYARPVQEFNLGICVICSKYGMSVNYLNFNFMNQLINI